jgi:hypothetical protein
MWTTYEPYADTDFCKAFATDEDTRFWEMYLTLILLEGRKTLRKRAELTLAQRNTGPDICIEKGNRLIWIEAMAPDQGDEKNLDRVPELKAGLSGANDNPRRQIELRITHALRTKAKQFAGYREQGIIGEKDSCIVAVSAGQFALQAAGEVLPHPISAVYPIGEEITTLDSKTGQIRTRYTYSAEIERKKGTKPQDAMRENVARTAFRNENYKSIAGLIGPDDRSATSWDSPTIFCICTIKRPSGQFRGDGSGGPMNTFQAMMERNSSGKKKIYAKRVLTGPCLTPIGWRIRADAPGWATEALHLTLSPQENKPAKLTLRSG